MNPCPHCRSKTTKILTRNNLECQICGFTWPIADEEANEKRCIAHQIILDLLEGKYTSQIQLLHMVTTLACKQLDIDRLEK